MSDLDPADNEARELDLRRRLKECDGKLARYRELLEVNSEITSAAAWIAEVERERRNIERDLRRKPTPRKHTKNEIKALVRQLKDIVGTLANADPEDKRAVYDELGVNLTYHQDGRVHVAAGARVLRDRVGGTSWALGPHVSCGRCSSSPDASDIGRGPRFVEESGEVELSCGLVEVGAVQHVALDPEDSDYVTPLPFRFEIHAPIPVELAQDLIFG